MGKKAPKQTKAAASKQSAASVPKQPKQPKKKKELTYDSLRDPLDRELALVGLRVKQITAGSQLAGGRCTCQAAAFINELRL